MVISKRLRVAVGVLAGVSIISGLAFYQWLAPSHAARAATCTRTVTNTGNSGAGSLRQAITDSNAASDADVICFSIGSGPQTIIPTSAMPPIINDTVIDGTTQPGWTSAPIIELSGQGAGAGARGFYVSGNGSGSTIRGMIINRFSAHGIFIDTSNVTVAGNYIGTNAAGSGGMGNGDDGIGIFSGTSLASANSNVIGGTVASDRNVISGNVGNGIGVSAMNGGAANNNTISGNYVGTNAAGTAAIGNVGDGVLLNNVSGAGSLTGNTIGGVAGITVGGACTGACNLLSGNGANGAGIWHLGATGNSFLGNYVGTNAAGTGAIANYNIGLEVNEAPNNAVGGTTLASRNVLSGNGGAGLFLTGAAATGNTVEGNYIGTNAAGTAAVANIKMGIGVGLSPNAVAAHSDTIGGTIGTSSGMACTGACNLISGNNQNGILILGSEAYGHTIVGNHIGLNAAGTGAIGNGLDGIGILNTPNTVIGDGTTGGQNVIGSNGGNGINVAGGASTGNRINKNIIGAQGFGNVQNGVAVSAATDTAILANSIYFNGFLGIDLDYNNQVNANDNADGDSGANRLQNFPDIYAARNLSGSTKIGGQFNSLPSTSFQLDFFYSDGCNGGPPRNYGQAQNYAGSTSISTDQFGNTAFGFTPSSQIPGNKYVTATATKKIGATPAETSEFSKCVLVNAGKPAVTNGANWYLKDYLITGGADKSFGYGFPPALLMCAWDANQPGVKLPVVVGGGSTWYQRASYTTGTADNSFTFGFSGGTPVCGDWNGDGVDTPGLFAGGVWYLRNSNTTGGADITFGYGGSSAPVVGDWDGDGTDTIGIYTNGRWQLRDTNSSGAPDYDYNFSAANTSRPVVGDWNGDGSDTPGLFSTSSLWTIRNSNSAGTSDGTFTYGFSGVTPLLW